MSFRLSQKLNDKIGTGRLPALPLDDNPFADCWQCFSRQIERSTSSSATPPLEDEIWLQLCKQIGGAFIEGSVWNGSMI
jgi:hypothetical protein